MALFSRTNSAGASGFSPRNLRCSFTAIFIKLAIDTPGISTVLKSEKQPHAGTLLDGQRQQVLPQEVRRP